MAFRCETDRERSIRKVAAAPSESAIRDCAHFAKCNIFDKANERFVPLDAASKDGYVLKGDLPLVNARRIYRMLLLCISLHDLFPKF